MIEGLIVSLQFLTRLPVNISVDFNKETIGKSTLFFPYVGMLLGLISYLPYRILVDFNQDLASFSVVLMMIFLTGGLHLDGVSDMVDGFFSGRNKEKILEIMDDSRIGAFGVISLIMLLLLKYIVLTSISSKYMLLALIFSMGNARFMALVQIAYRKIVKPGGMGDMIHSSNNQKYIVIGLLSYIIISILLDIRLIFPLLASFVMAEGISRLAYKKIGGFTGDLYGATVELCEVVSLILFLGAV